MQRPQVYPGLPRAWRDATSVQWGLPGQRGVVLTGLEQGDDAVLDALDGVHDLAALRRLAATRSLSPDRPEELLRLLAGASVLLDGPKRINGPPTDRVDRADLSALPADLRQRWAADADAWGLVYDTGTDGLSVLLARQRRHVRVEGAGRLGLAIATSLSMAGVGIVSVGDDCLVVPTDVGPASHSPADIGASRAASALRLLVGWGANAAPDSHPDLVVLVREDAIDVREADRLVAAGQDHLAVVCAADRISVGPLVTPGHGPCLRCLDLHRCDLDPAWPQIAAQMCAGSPSGSGSGSGRARGESASCLVAAGLAALQALLHLDGRLRPIAHGHTVDVQLPDGLTDRRRWPVHPSCGCAVLPDPDDDPTGSVGWVGPAAAAEVAHNGSRE